MARPKTKYKKRDIVIQKLEEAFAFDATVLEACFYADISSSFYYNLLEEKPELVERFATLRQRPVLLARQTVVRNLSTDPDLALKYLERKKKGEFSTRNENVNADITMEELMAKFDDPDDISKKHRDNVSTELSTDEDKLSTDNDEATEPNENQDKGGESPEVQA